MVVSHTINGVKNEGGNTAPARAPFEIFQENKTDVTLSFDDQAAEMNAVRAGNRWDIAAGSKYAYLHADSDDGLTPEEKEAKKRQEIAQRFHIIQSNAIVTQKFYNELLGDLEKQLASHEQERKQLVDKIEHNEQRILQLDAEAQKIHGNIARHDNNIADQHSKLVSSANHFHDLEDKCDHFRRIHKNGGAIDHDGNEYAPIEPGSDGKPRFARTNEAGHTVIADSRNLIAGDDLKKIIDKTSNDRDNAEETLEADKTKLSDLEKFRADYVERVTPVLNRISEERLKLQQQNGDHLENLESLDKRIESLSKSIDFMKDEDTVQRLKDGTLTAEELRDGVDSLSWNVFVDKNEQYRDMPRAEMDADAQKLYNDIMSRSGPQKSFIPGKEPGPKQSFAPGKEPSPQKSFVPGSEGRPLSILPETARTTSLASGDGVKTDVPFASDFNTARTGFMPAPDISTPENSVNLTTRLQAPQPTVSGFNMQ